MLLLSLGLLLTLFVPRFQSNRQTINQIFENARLFTRDLKGNIHKPILLRSHQKETHTTYIYKMPLGIPFKKLQVLNDDIGLFSDGLGKHTIVEYKDGVVLMRVFHKNLPGKVMYNEQPIIEIEVESTDRSVAHGDDLPRLRQDTTLDWRGNNSIWENEPNQNHHGNADYEQSQSSTPASDRLKSRG